MLKPLLLKNFCSLCHKFLWHFPDASVIFHKLYNICRWKLLDGGLFHLFHLLLCFSALPLPSIATHIFENQFLRLDLFMKKLISSLHWVIFFLLLVHIFFVELENFCCLKLAVSYFTTNWNKWETKKKLILCFHSEEVEKKITNSTLTRRSDE